MSAPATGVAAMTVTEIANLLREYAGLLGEAKEPGTHYPPGKEIENALGVFADSFEIARDPEQKVLFTGRQIREEVGMCPDGGDHWYAECGPYECPTFREAEAEDAAEERRHRGW